MSELHPKPGIYQGMSWADYLRVPYLSPSTLKSGLRSMKRLKRKIDGDVPPPNEKTTAIGNAVHCMIAGEAEERLAIMPAFEKDEKNLTKGSVKKPPASMTKKDGSLSAAGQKWKTLCEEHQLDPNFTGEIWVDRIRTDSKSTDYYQSMVTDFEESNPGKTILTEVQDATAKKIVSNVWANRRCAELIRQAESEVTVVAQVDGVMVKTRMDFLNFNDAAGADLKTTTDIEPRAFYRKCKDLNYLFQFGCHNLFLQNAGLAGFQLQSYDVIAAETGDDYDVGLIQILPFDLLDIWAEKARQVINQYSLATATGNWLGLYPEVGLLEVPEYDMTESQIDNVQWGQ